MMNEQIGLLRDEVAALRAEVVDKLGGQLRLERIETTRLIGSDLEALQHEIRRLAGSQESIAVGRPSLGRGQVLRDIVDAEVVEAEEEIRVERIRVEASGGPGGRGCRPAAARPGGISGDASRSAGAAGRDARAAAGGAELGCTDLDRPDRSVPADRLVATGQLVARACCRRPSGGRVGASDG